MAALATFLLAMAAQAAAPTGLADRLASIGTASATPAACAAQVARANLLNGPDLFYGAALCSRAGSEVEAAFLLNAGQSRSMVDMGLMVPAARADAQRTIELYGFIYAVAGGPGADVVFRDPASRTRFLALYDGWRPVAGADYDPGWATRRRPDAARYQAAIVDVVAGRRAQLIEIVSLFGDEAYYALHREREALQRRTGGVYHEGTPDYRENERLDRAMRARAVALGFPRPEPAAVPTDAEMQRIAFPPPSPAAGESVQHDVDADDEVVRFCAEGLERQSIAFDKRILRVLVTQSPEWGIIWRADIADPQGQVERYTCTRRASSSQPLNGGGEPLAPLPAEGPPPPG